MGGVVMVITLGLMFSSGADWVSADEKKKEVTGDVKERSVSRPPMAPLSSAGTMAPAIGIETNKNANHR